MNAGVALTVALDTTRVSRDLDLFHDTLDAVARSWDADRMLVQTAGYHVNVLRERPGYVVTGPKETPRHFSAECPDGIA